MKYLNIFCLISCLIIFDSCRKEESTVLEPIVETEAPTEVEYPVFVGSVSDQGEGIDNAIVKVYQEDGLKGEIITKEDGSFTTIGIVLDENVNVTFAAEKQDYFTSYKRRNTSVSASEPIDLNIGLNSTVPGFTVPIDNPADPKFITISGYVLTPEGDPSMGTGLCAYNIVEVNPNTTWSMEGQIFKPDQNGYFEILMPKDTEFNYIFWEEDCSIKLTGNDAIIFNTVESQLIGPYTEDIQLPDLIDTADGPFVIDFHGEILECGGGSPAYIAEIKIKVFDGDTPILNYTASSDEEGNYEFNREMCTANDIKVEFWGYDRANNKLTDTIELTQSMLEGGLHVAPLEACNDGFVGFSQVTLTTGGTTHTYDQNIIELENGDLVSKTLGFNVALFTIPNAQPGENEMLEYYSFNWSDGFSFTAEEGSVVVTLEELSDSHAKGTFTGSFIDGITGEAAEGTGTLDLVF